MSASLSLRAFIRPNGDCLVVHMEMAPPNEATHTASQSFMRLNQGKPGITGLLSATQVRTSSARFM